MQRLPKVLLKEMTLIIANQMHVDGTEDLQTCMRQAGWSMNQSVMLVYYSLRRESEGPCDELADVNTCVRHAGWNIKQPAVLF